MATVKVHNPNVTYKEDYLESSYTYENSVVHSDGETYNVVPQKVDVSIRTQSKVPRTGLMLVGWGGNNGSTLTAALLAHRLRLQWRTRHGTKKANFFGSLTQASTMCLGMGRDGRDVYIPFKDVLPLLNPDDIVLDGWDISSLDLAASMERARVLDYDVQVQLKPYMEHMKPRPSVYFPQFIAANQEERADNVLKGSKLEQLNQIRDDINDFKKKEKLDKVIVFWTANTERFCDIVCGFNDTKENLMRAVAKDWKEISPSTLFALASILENCAYINGSPQNTFVPGVIELARDLKVFIGGDDLKSGQTKLKSVLVDFLIGAGLKPVSIVSYNHLGNNDGKNLSAPQQFESKEISKSNVVDDMVESNRILYEEGEKPDHCVVIKYVPYVGDSKRAMDEYTSEMMFGGHNTIVLHNTCEDSLLATPIILDLVILTELCQRIRFKVDGNEEFQTFHAVLSILSYFCKAPLVPTGTPVVNALFKQRACIENLFRACVGLPPINHLSLEQRLECFPRWTSCQNGSECNNVKEESVESDLISCHQCKGVCK